MFASRRVAEDGALLNSGAGADEISGRFVGSADEGQLAYYEAERNTAIDDLQIRSKALAEAQAEQSFWAKLIDPFDGRKSAVEFEAERVRESLTKFVRYNAAAEAVRSGQLDSAVIDKIINGGGAIDRFSNDISIRDIDVLQRGQEIYDFTKAYKANIDGLKGSADSLKHATEFMKILGAKDNLGKLTDQIGKLTQGVSKGLGVFSKTAGRYVSPYNAATQAGAAASDLMDAKTSLPEAVNNAVNAPETGDTYTDLVNEYRRDNRAVIGVHRTNEIMGTVGNRIDKFATDQIPIPDDLYEDD